MIELLQTVVTTVTSREFIVTMIQVSLISGVVGALTAAYESWRGR